MTTNDYKNYVMGSWIGDLAHEHTVGNTVSPETLASLSSAASCTFRAELDRKASDALTSLCASLAKKEKSKPPMPEVIMEREKKGGHFTTVKWNDGTYTTVKASEGDEGERSTYMAFCAALAKKLYGTNSAVHRMVDRHSEAYIKAEKQKAASEQRAKERAAEQAAHERALLREAKRLRLKEEAKAYNRAHKQDEE